MYLGIEIGGTKLQLGVGHGDGGPLVELRRLDVDPRRGAAGLRQDIERVGKSLLASHAVTAAGVGFGGPIDTVHGRTIKSHHIEGWNGFPLVDWCRQTLGLPTVLANDADTAGLAEARFGAGRGHRIVFYITVGTGIGGAMVVDRQIYQGGGGIASEMGHLRPGPQAQGSDQILEATSAGWGITSTMHQRLAQNPESPEATDLRRRCQGDFQRLTTKLIGQAAQEGNALALDVLDGACRTLGWAIAQMITLVAPNVVVIGGGVSLVGQKLFFEPVGRYVQQYVFPPLKDAYQIVPAALSEEVVIHGALALASTCPA